MNSLMESQMELSLLGSLSNYGLNPNDWLLEMNREDIRKACQLPHIKKIVVRNKDDKDFKFLGSAKIKRVGRFLKASWMQLSMIA